MTATAPRIETFVDWFIRSGWVDAQWSALSLGDMYQSDPDRARRCDDAASEGCDGSTHQEIIEDWRAAFTLYLQDRRGWHQVPERFARAVRAHFDGVEEWHRAHGSLETEIG